MIFSSFPITMTFVLSDIKVRLFPKKEGELILSDIMVFYFFPGRSSNLPARPGQYSFAFTIIVP